MTEYVRLEDLLALCADLGDLTVRDLGLFEAAALRPVTSLYGRDEYPGGRGRARALGGTGGIARSHEAPESARTGPASADPVPH